MPVLVNAQTGLAEDLPPQLASQALSQNTHQLPLNDPDGNPVVAPHDQAADLLSQGYRQPSTEQLKSLLDYAKYSTPTEQLKTGLEGAASAATFGLSKGVERALGANPEDIAGRAEVNPGIHGIGELAGLVGSSFIPGVGAANLLGRAGEAAATGLGLGAEGAGLLTQVGSAAAKGAVENALFQAGDEVGKMFASNDPAQVMQSAIPDIGLSAIIGGGLSAPFGAVPAIWASAKESSLGRILNAIKDKANGVSKEALPTSVDALADKAGITLAPEVKVAMVENPELQKTFSQLQESTTSSGLKAQEALKEFKTSANDAILNSIGKSTEAVEAGPALSDYEAGNKLKESVISELKKRVNPLAESFNEIKDKYKAAPVLDEEKADLANQIAAVNERFKVSPSSDEFKKINNILSEIPNIKTLEDLRNFQSAHLGDIANKHLWSINAPIRQAFRDAEENIVMKNLGDQAPALIEQHKAARNAYRAAMNDIDALNDRLRVGRYSGPDTFFHALNEMKPEDVLRRLTARNDAGLIDLASNILPETSQVIKDFHLSNLIRTAANKAGAGETINPKVFFKALDEWSPELKKYVLPEGSEGKIGAVRSLIDSIPARMNPSGTAKTLDALWAQLPGGVGAMASVLTGHNPLAGYILGEVAKYASREVPDAARLGMLKFLGSNQPLNAGAFKAMVDYASHVIKGEALLSKATKALFKAGVEVLPQSLMPTPEKRTKLEKKLKDLQSNNTGLMDIGGQIGHYLPDHGVAFGATAANAIDYLNSLRPKTAPMAPLDPPMNPSPMVQARYNRALDVAEQPLVVIQSIKQGNLTAQDVQDLRTMYPKLYQGLSQKLMNEMVSHLSGGKSIDYGQRLSLSLFLGEDLDSTMTPQAIMAAQPQMAQRQAQAEREMKAPRGSQMKSLNKLASQSQTPFQARASQKINS